jgi:phospholipase C
MTRHGFVPVLLAIGFLLVQPAAVAVAQPVRTTTPIEHFVVLMQSNHSFDNYFGTYPGADGIPANTCLPLNTDNSTADNCVKPFKLGDQSPSDLDHRPGTQRVQLNDGKMNGFVAAYRRKGRDGTNSMGYYDGADLPYYWSTAANFTLFDRFFSSASTGSRLNHFYWVAGVPTPGGTERVPAEGYGDIPTIFDRLEAKGVPWKFYVENYDPKITLRTPGTGPKAGQTTKVPLLNYARFLDNPALFGKIADLSEYYRDLKAGTLPSVAYVVSAGSSENPPSRVQAGETLVRDMTSELARSQYWSKSAFMLTYDGWGGFYDHVAPPKVDQYGYGFRVPTLLMSAYSRRGHIEHTQLDYTSVLKFVEDNWSLAPLGERDAKSASLAGAFDFGAPPRAPELVGTASPASTPPTGRAPIVYTTYGAAVLLAAAFVLGPAGVRRLRTRRQQA